VQCGFKILKISSYTIKNRSISASLSTESYTLEAGENVAWEAPPSVILPEARYFRIIAKPDEKRVLRANRLEAKESLPAENQESLESIIATMSD